MIEPYIFNAIYVYIVGYSSLNNLDGVLYFLLNCNEQELRIIIQAKIKKVAH
jgi:hypothetical protein